MDDSGMKVGEGGGKSKIGRWTVDSKLVIVVQEPRAAPASSDPRLQRPGGRENRRCTG